MAGVIHAFFFQECCQECLACVVCLKASQPVALLEGGGIFTGWDIIQVLLLRHAMNRILGPRPLFCFAPWLAGGEQLPQQQASAMLCGLNIGPKAMGPISVE